LLNTDNTLSWVLIRFFWLVFGWYFLVFTKLIPEENLVGHFGIIILAGTPFFLVRGVTAPFFRGPAPILRKKGFPAKPLRVPAKFFSAQNTDQNTDRPAPVYGRSIPILAKLPVSKRYPTLDNTTDDIPF
jgi:hypothetical protein